MPVINKSTVVPYSQEKMFALVNDVSRYADFLPWCSESTVLTQNDHEVTGRLTLSHMGVQKTFTTVNHLKKPKMIEIRLLDGPFKHLEGYWRFEGLNGGGCRVSLDLNFEFSSTMLGLLFGPVFHQVASSLVDAFVERAENLYAE